MKLLILGLKFEKPDYRIQRTDRIASRLRTPVYKRLGRPSKIASLKPPKPLTSGH
jgi:hypothetical protein